MLILFINLKNGTISTQNGKRINIFKQQSMFPLYSYNFCNLQTSAIVASYSFIIFNNLLFVKYTFMDKNDEMIK